MKWTDLLLILYRIIHIISYHIMKSKITDRKCKDCDGKLDILINDFLIFKLLYFNMLGLKQICRHNRDILFRFHILTRKQIMDLIKTKIYENYSILIPPYIYK